MKIKDYLNDGTISIDDKLIGTDANDSNSTKTYTIGGLSNFIVTSQSIAFTYDIPTLTVNSTTSPLSLATLNFNYSGLLIGSRVSCANIIGGGLIYTKTGVSTWVSSSITAVV